MMTPHERPEILFTNPGPRVAIPSWAKGLQTTRATAAKLATIPQLPPLTVVQAGAVRPLVLEHAPFLEVLARGLDRTTRPAKVLFVLAATRQTPAENMLPLFSFFRCPGDVELARSEAEARFAVEEAVAKIWADLERAEEAARPADPLGQVKSVIAATADLRAESGRLSAKRVAAAFGVSVATLSDLLGKRRQTVSKTDDAEGLQPGLRPFERIARLRAVLTPPDFLRWLNLENEPLEGQAPLAVIRAGEAEAVADLVENMLVGNPL